MRRFVFGLSLACAIVFSSLAAPVCAAPPSPASSGPDAAKRDSARDAGTIVGVVTSVVYTPGKSKMIVRAQSVSYDFAVLPGTNVQGPSHDFTVDVKVGTHVSVSASKSGESYTAQIVRVLPARGGH